MLRDYKKKRFLNICLIIILIVLIIKFIWWLVWCAIILSAFLLGNWGLNHLHSKSAQIDHSPKSTDLESSREITKYVDEQCDYIDALTGNQFEIYMVKLLTYLGFHDLQHTQFTRDKGLDAVGYNNEKQKVGFQFKHYQQCVGYDAVMQTLSGGQYYNTDVNYIISTDGFTADALHNAEVINHNHPEDNLHLLDRSDLRHLIKLSA